MLSELRASSIERDKKASKSGFLRMSKSGDAWKKTTTEVQRAEPAPAEPEARRSQDTPNLAQPRTGLGKVEV